MRISDASRHLKKTSLWDIGNQAEADAELTTSVILNKATATIRASLGVNAPQNIWSALGLHLSNQLLQQKAVGITDFGAFGFNLNNEPTFVQDPVFLHMTRLCLASRKRGDRVQLVLRQSDDITDINLNELAAEHLQNCSKELVKAVISSVLAWVVAWAKDGQEMRLSFLPVGEWICDGDSVDFRFSESFRKEVELQKAKNDEARTAETTLDTDGRMNNQIEGLNLAGENSAITPFPGCADVKLDSFFEKESIAVDTSLPAAKVVATRSGSPVAHSRYKLRAPTFSSKAKQLPPHAQRRYRPENEPKITSSNSKVKATGSGRKSARDHSTIRHEPQGASNSAEIEDIANNIVAALQNVRPGTVSTGKSKQRPRTTSRLNAQQTKTINRLVKRISTRRSQTLQGLNALVAVFASFKTGCASSSEVSLSLRKLGVKVSSAELKEIAAAFAHDKQGFIDTSELVAALRGPPLSGVRLDLVTKAFHQLDPAGRGAVTIDQMIRHYDVGFLPQVREGKQSRLEALTAFLQEWNAVGTVNGNVITFKAFVEYYHNVSACIGKDADFARLMQQAWCIPEGHHGCENHAPGDMIGMCSGPATSPGTPVTPAVPSPQSSQTKTSQIAQESATGITADHEEEISPCEAWSYLRALLLILQPNQVRSSAWSTLDKMCRRLGANRILGDGNETMNVKAFTHALSALDKGLTQKKAYDLSRFVALHCADALTDGDTIVLPSLYRVLVAISHEPTATQTPLDCNSVEVHASRAIERIRTRVKGAQVNQYKTGSEPLVDLSTLEKWLQASSSNGDSLLLKYELRSALQKVGVDISYQDLDYLFVYFDDTRQGYISYESLLDVLRSNTSVLPKLTKLQERGLADPEQKPNADADFHQPFSSVTKTPTQTTTRRKRQIAPRTPEPNFRRRNLIHRAIWDQPRRPTANAAAEAGGNLDKLEIERRRRYRAAQLIQTAFRGFRARQIAAQLRRKAAAINHRLSSLAWERERLIAKKKKANRTVMPSAYGF